MLNPYAVARNQLGSIRRVYLASDAVVPRGDLGERDELVLLLHGFFQTRNIWEVMEDRLRFDGYGVMSFHLGGLLWKFNTNRVDELARRIADKIEGLAERHGFRRVHIVGHSKGGLVARRYIQHFGGDKRVKSLVTLGSPHHGTPVAALGVALMGFGVLSKSPWDMMPGSGLVSRLGQGPFPGHIPLLSVYSRADVICPYPYSILSPRPGEHHLSNAEVRGVGHSELVWDPGVYRLVKGHLERSAAIWHERQAIPGEAR